MLYGEEREDGVASGGERQWLMDHIRSRAIKDFLFWR